MKVVFILLGAVVCISTGLLRPSFIKSECNVNSDCGAGRCCVLNTKITLDYNGGTCVDYVKEGRSCHYLDHTSCGCEPGTKCQYYPEDTESMVGRRGAKLPMPGKSICEAD